MTAVVACGGHRVSGAAAPALLLGIGSQGGVSGLRQGCRLDSSGTMTAFRRLPATSIGFDLPAAGRVRLSIYDIRGAHVIDLLDEARRAGSHRVEWSGIDAAGRAVASGIYLYRLRWQGRDGTHQQETRQTVLVR